MRDLIIPLRCGNHPILRERETPQRIFGVSAKLPTCPHTLRDRSSHVTYAAMSDSLGTGMRIGPPYIYFVVSASWHSTFRNGINCVEDLSIRTIMFYQLKMSFMQYGHVFRFLTHRSGHLHIGVPPPSPHTHPRNNSHYLPSL